jgi:N-acetylglucosamine-6-phosphate deacetylase
MTKSESDADEPLVLTNVNIVLPDRIIRDGFLEIKGEHLGRIGEGSGPAAPRIIDGKGLFAAPGFIDIHCHGDGVVLFFPDSSIAVASLLKSGTTGVLATLGYDVMQSGSLHRQITDFWAARDETAAQVVLGIHLEGPYTNPKYGAMLQSADIRLPDPAEYGPILEQSSDVVRYWTLAPEMEGALPFAEAASARGVILAAGHTEASAVQLDALMKHGLRVATHWTNASGEPPPRSGFAGIREPGIDEFALVDDRMFAEVICDSEGYHVHPLMLQLLYKVKGADGIILITDAWRQCAGEPDRPEADVRFSPTGELCGSRLTMAAAARNFRKQTQCDLVSVFRMGSLNPARLFGWDGEMGSLEEGKVANVLLIDDKLNVHRVWLRGQSQEL